MRQLITFKRLTRLGHSAGIVNQLKCGRLPLFWLLPVSHNNSYCVHKFPLLPPEAMQHLTCRYGIVEIYITTITTPSHAAPLISFNEKRIDKFTIFSGYPYNIFITVKLETALTTSRSAVPISFSPAETSAANFLSI